MEGIIELIPDNLKVWVKNLSNEDISAILTRVGTASICMDDYKTTSDKKDSKSLTSACIGLEGEHEIAKILQERYTILNTAKSGKCGDFIVTVNNIRVLIEVKKYSKTVPSAEIDKFYRDIDSNSSISGAIFISMTSKVVGINKSIDYTHHYINGDNIPVLFISLVDMDPQISKTCIYSAVDIILSEIDSKSKYINIGENIAYAVDDIDRNLDFLSQCRLMIHETQSMFNKQLGKLMQQVLSAEINIKNAIRVLKTKVEILEVKDNTGGCSIKDVLSNINVELSSDKYNMVYKILDGRVIIMSKSRDTLHTTDKKIMVKINKSVIRVSITIELKKSICIDGQWTYNGKTLTMELTEKSLHTIIDLMECI